MQKVYLLLRNNQQTGPHNLEELIQFNLQPFDLIWIEGKSAGWYYPQEIIALQPHLPFLRRPETTSTVPDDPVELPKFAQATPPKKVFVSMPPSNDRQEQVSNKEALPASQISRHASILHDEGIKDKEQLKTRYTKDLEAVEKDYTSWSYQKKTKKKKVSRKGVLAACLVAGVAFAGWWVVNSYTDRPQKIERLETAVVPAQNEIIPDSSNESIVSQPAIISSKKQKQKPAVPAENKYAKKGNKNLVITNEPSAATEAAIDKNSNETQPTPDKNEANVAIEEQAKNEPVVAEASKEKKKKLGEKILDLFKKKPEQKSNEQAKTSTEEDGERRSNHRDNGTNLAQFVTVKFSIPNDWMMGIKGAKAILNNRSNETIVKATIEVEYYNDDHELLDKKAILFTNIGAKKTQSIAIPDHSTATRVDYKIVSVAGANEPFARR